MIVILHDEKRRSGSALIAGIESKSMNEFELNCTILQ